MGRDDYLSEPRSPPVTPENAGVQFVHHFFAFAMPTAVLDPGVRRDDNHWADMTTIAPHLPEPPPRAVTPA